MQRALERFSELWGAVPLVGGSVALPALTGGSDAFLALTIASAGRCVLVVAPGLPDAERLTDDLTTLAGVGNSPAYATRILEFPPALPDDRSTTGLRLRTVAALKAWAVRPYSLVVVASAPALSGSAPSGGTDPLRLEAGSKTELSSVVKGLAAIGYARVPTVESEGQFSVRGGIVDAWSPGEEFPVRAEFFGEELESLRLFDAATQISVERVPAASLLPAREEGEDAPRETLLARLPDGAAVLCLDHNAYSLPELSARGGLELVYCGDPAPRGVVTAEFPTAPLPGFSELGMSEAHHPELFEAARARLDRYLAAARARGDHVVKADGLSAGFSLPGLVVVSKADRVFAKRRAHVRSAAAVRPAGARISDFEDLEPGEYVVHVDYGVGRFVGSSEIVTDGRRDEVFTVEYADGAKLHVPTSHAHLLSRYVGVRGESVKLHRLDGRRWEKDRRDAQKAVMDLAATLLETQARRESAPGFAYDVRCEGRAAFDAAFPYEETPDQAAAIAAIDADLAAPRPMDRLVCGDAGYGKTEVAMRAAFVVAMNGRQVAVLAPTTVLAEQHFETFTSRFDGTPIRIESVSRFQSSRVHDGTFARLESGVCDIVIGTHAILSSRIRFHDLGLVIIDEEQRFGVRHKEFLKRLRATADVLTLSATPIPRTLYMSMTGARDLSLLRTPPRARVAVDMKIVRDSDEMIATAVEAELARGGQVFFLHNRVMTMARVERRLRSIVPNARIVVAHGQMDAATLARKMRDFEQGRYDVLLSTTIVESGIDIPRANTIIVDQADAFGMADLYQLRGRVGRASVQGRAVFLLPPSGVIDAEARERLDALKRYGGLGAGFHLAVRDLELRGAGNLLGAEQSGHIAAVGFTLYCQLLKRTISRLKGDKVADVVDVKLNFDFISHSPAEPDDPSAAALPYSYVEEDAQRMGFMRRLAEAARPRDVGMIERELRDRFGPVPSAAQRLLQLTRLRIACAEAGIGSIDSRDGRAFLRRASDREIVDVIELKGATPDRRLKELMEALKR